MAGNVERIKDRLDIVEIARGYFKLDKAGANYKARCPFHNEKTPSFVISPTRQNFYCFGCGAKGDIFTLVEEFEGLDFRGALKYLSEKAGVELSIESKGTRTEKDKMIDLLLKARQFFEIELSQNDEAVNYLLSRGLTESTLKDWNIGYAPKDWRTLLTYLESKGYKRDDILRVGLIKNPNKDDQKKETNPYDVFRDRIIFPISNPNGNVIAFSGRALSREVEPKYINTPDTPLFTKGEVLYGFDKAKGAIRKKGYTVLVEGQIDLVLSHQAGVLNTVASSGTAFTQTHLERLKKLSSRIILAFDGDEAGEKAAEKSTILALMLGMEVKIARLPKDSDPAEVINKDIKEWKDILRRSETCIEYFLENIYRDEKDQRKQGKLIEKKILPLIAILGSAIERSHFISLVSKRAMMREEVLMEDLRKVDITNLLKEDRVTKNENVIKSKEKIPRKTSIERRLIGIIFWQQNLDQPLLDVSSLKAEMSARLGEEYLGGLEKSLIIDKDVLIFEAESYYNDPETLSKDVVELLDNLSDDILRETLANLVGELSRSEAKGDKAEIEKITKEIQIVHKEMANLEERRKMW